MVLKTLFVITISTARMVFPGMSILPDMQPGEAPPAVQAVSKSVSMTLSTEKRTDEIPSVQVNVPEGLGVGPSVKLIVESSKPETDKDKAASNDSVKIKTKTYWGSAEAVPWGQPKTEEVSSATPTRANSYAYWPIGYRKEKVAGPTSELAGKYTLTSNFAGGTSVTVDKEQCYLDPINLVGLKESVDPTKPIKIKWTKVPKAVGYVVAAFGGNDDESIIWTSGSDPKAALEAQDTPITKDVAADYIKKSILLPPDSTICTIPAGVFQAATNMMVTVTAFGADKVSPGKDMDTQVLVRSIASIPMTLEIPAPAPPSE